MTYYRAVVDKAIVEKIPKGTLECSFGSVAITDCTVQYEIPRRGPLRIHSKQAVKDMLAMGIGARVQRIDYDDEPRS